MSRIKRLIRPDTPELNWKTATVAIAMGAALFAHGASAANSAEPEHPAIANFESCKRPEYPAESLAAKHTGTVSLGFLVAQDGTVKDTKITTSSGHRLLDESARTALAKCTFRPATTKGKPVEAWTAVQYVWTLK